MMATYARILAGLYGMVVALIIIAAYLTIQYAGYPDGHVTEYERAIRTPLIICNVINIVAAIFFIRESLFNRNIKLMKVCGLIVVHVIFLLSYTMGLEWYYKSYLGLDHGQGG